MIYESSAEVVDVLRAQLGRPSCEVVDVKREAVAVPVGVQGLAATEREPEIGDGVQGELSDEALERSERHRGGFSTQLARLGCWASQNWRTARGRLSVSQSRRSRSAFR